MDHTEGVVFSKAVSSFRWIAEGNPCSEDVSLLILGDFLKCIFYQ